MTQLRKGLLELAVLNAISAAPLYGYDIVRRLRDVEHLVITEGTVYPILSRLRNSCLVETYIEESQEGPAPTAPRRGPVSKEAKPCRSNCVLTISPRPTATA